MEKNIMFNHAFFAEAKKALVDTGIEVVMQEIAGELELKGKRPYGRITWQNPYETESYQSTFHEIRIGEIRAESDSLLINWRENEKEYYWETYALSVVYHSDGRLEFQSAVGSTTVRTPETSNPTGEKSIFLTREQWLTDEDLVAKSLEAAIKSPTVYVHEKERWEPSGKL